jgi:hypothetical protein
MEQAVQSYACVIDENVDRNSRSNDVCPQLERRSRVRQILRLDAHGDLMSSPKVRRQMFQPSTIASDNHNVMAVSRKEPRQLETDPSGGASNQSRSIS